MHTDESPQVARFAPRAGWSLQGSEAVCAVAAEVDLHAAPQVLDEAELTVELGKHENAVARLHDDFLEIWYYQIPSLNLVRLGKKLAFSSTFER